MRATSPDVLLISIDPEFRAQVTRHCGSPGDLACAGPEDLLGAKPVLARQVWVDLDSAPSAVVPANTRIVYFYSNPAVLSPALPSGLYIRKPCAAVLFEALWSDAATRQPGAGAQSRSPQPRLPNWLMEFHELALPALVRKLVTRLPALLGYRYGSLYLHDADAGALRLADTTHERPVSARVSLDAANASPLARVAMDRRIIRTERAADEWRALGASESSSGAYADQACLVAALATAENLWGAVCLSERTRSALDDEKEPLADIVAFIARAVSHASAFESARTEARVDTLTGLFNRRWIYESLEREIHRAARFKTALSALLVDLDGLKSVNDRFGHAAGDEVVRRAADRIRAALRHFDGAARLGGDEFLVVLPGTGLEGAVNVARRVLESITAEPVDVDGGRVAVAASIGAAEWREGMTSAVLEAEADAAMYAAKSSGRNQVCAATAVE